MSSLRPVLMPNQTTEIRMALRDQTIEIPDFPLIPLRGVNEWCDRGEQTVLSRQLYSQQHPRVIGAEREQILNLVFLRERGTIEGERRGQPASPLLMKKLCEFRDPALLNAIVQETVHRICRSQAREGHVYPLFKG